ncbi:MAG: NADH:flavin oxidoreductase/NADH oxidase [Micrococcaceae bacterium]
MTTISTSAPASTPASSTVSTPASTASPFPHLLDTITIGPRTLRNRTILAPMCMYSISDHDGVPRSWHQVHLGARAAGGFGMVVAEATAVSPEARISPADVGLWNDTQRDAWAPIVETIRSLGALPAVQLAHAGAKASTEPGLPGYTGASVGVDDDGWQTVSPSGINPVSGLADTRELTGEQVRQVVADFVTSARRADEAGFDAVMIHAAHGYLIHQFLSPVTNQRTDEYGGSVENRTRLLREILAEVRAVWPKEKILGLRISGSDYVEGSWSIADSEALITELVATPEARALYGLDWVDVSSGGIGDTYQGPAGPGYQVQLAERITAVADRVAEAGRETERPLTVSAVGVITEPGQAQQIVLSGQAHAVSIGRAGLADPNWPARAAARLRPGADAPYPPQYHRAVRAL